MSHIPPQLQKAQIVSWLISAPFPAFVAFCFSPRLAQGEAPPVQDHLHGASGDLVHRHQALDMHPLARHIADQILASRVRRERRQGTRSVTATKSEAKTHIYIYYIYYVGLVHANLPVCSFERDPVGSLWTQTGMRETRKISNNNEHLSRRRMKHLKGGRP